MGKRFNISGKAAAKAFKKAGWHNYGASWKSFNHGCD